jgi:hypothetical protein
MRIDYGKNNLAACASALPMIGCAARVCIGKGKSAGRMRSRDLVRLAVTHLTRPVAVPASPGRGLSGM